MKFCRIENGKVTNIINAEQAFIDTMTDTYVASETAYIGQEYDGTSFVVPVVVAKTIDELKAEKIKQLHTKFNTDYTNYLAQYPTIEIESFKDRGNEAKDYMLDNTTPTPLIDATLKVGYTEAQRVAEITAVDTKAKYILNLGGIARDTRDLINACTTQAELDAIVI